MLSSVPRAFTFETESNEKAKGIYCQRHKLNESSRMRFLSFPRHPCGDHRNLNIILKTGMMQMFSIVTASDFKLRAWKEHARRIVAQLVYSYIVKMIFLFFLPTFWTEWLLLCNIPAYHPVRRWSEVPHSWRKFHNFYIVDNFGDIRNEFLHSDLEYRNDVHSAAVDSGFAK